MHYHSVLILFARAPRPGETKTRLISALGDEGAAGISRCFFLDLLARAGREAADIVVAAAESEHLPQFEDLVADVCPRAELLAQTGEGLGERLLNAFRWAFRGGYRAAVVIGTDIPSLPSRLVSEALALAPERDVVLGPSRTGGITWWGCTR